MRIIVDARPMAEPIRGGVGRVALEVVDAFASANPETEIVCATTGSTMTDLPRRLMDRPNVKHVHLKIPNKLWSLASMLGLVSFCASAEKRCGPAHAFFMPNLGFVGRLPKAIPSVLLLHDLSFLIEPRWFTPKQRLWHRAVKATRLIRGVTRLLAVSETTKRDAMRLLDIPTGRIEVIPLGPTLSSHDPHPPPPSPRTRYVLALGSRDPRKNAATALEAVRELRKEIGFEDVGLVLVGEKYNVISTKRSARRNLPVGRSLDYARDDNPDFIEFASNPSDAGLAGLYRHAAVFLYPSWYEGYGLPLHEAASFGTPCVASTSGALPETAPPSTIFANPAKPRHWTEALKFALGQPRMRQQSAPRTWDPAASTLMASLKALDAK